MTKNEALKLLSEKIEASRAISTAGSLMHWDAAISGIPEKSRKKRGEAIGWLYGDMFKRFISADTLEAVEALEAVSDELNSFEKAMVREMGREYRKVKAVPPDKMQAFTALKSEAEAVWEKARELNDYQMISPYYEKIFAFQRKLCDWYGYKNHPYDALLDSYEKGMTVEMLDKFFGLLKEKLVPLIHSINKKANQPKEITGNFDIAAQRKLTPWLAAFVGYDVQRGKVGEVEHPFCATINRHDVRITTKYHQDNILSSLFSVIHESGHGLYEQNMSEELEPYGLDEAASMGMHESQSRLYENMIGRSRAFAKLLLPKLREQFSYFNDFDDEALFRAVNIVKPSLIRIEADELTYCFHIIIRYELEKALIMNEIKVADLALLWADKYEEMLGVRPLTFAEGVLQDVHWSAGLVGYFPSYAVGGAYGAQIVSAMKKTVDIDAAILSGGLSPINEWLKEKIHSPALLYSPEELLKKATGEAFNPEYYVRYLEEKFNSLYL